MKRILLFGGSGMLGRELSRCFSRSHYEMISPAHNEVDIGNQLAVFRAIRDTGPDIILNAAVLVNVDACEKSPDQAYAINTLGPLFIADALLILDRRNVVFVEFSSSDIFGGMSGTAPSEEEKTTRPVNVYGRSKYYAEQCIKGMLGEKEYALYIVRSSWIYSEFKKTFVDAIAEHVMHPNGIFETASDQRGIPTWGKEIAEHTRKLIEEKYPYGAYHFAPQASSTDATRFEIAREIARIFGRKDTDALFAKASQAHVFKTPRPASSVLSTTRFPALPNWKESLRVFLTETYIRS